MFFSIFIQLSHCLDSAATLAAKDDPSLAPMASTDLAASES